MKSLVSLDKNNHAFTTTLIIAQNVDLEHRSVRKLVDTYIDDFEDLREPPAAFEMLLEKRKGSAGKPTRYYVLSELQATFLITLMKNSKIVMLFKKSLSKEFFKMKKELAKIASQQTNEQWRLQRDSGKIERRVETEVIKEFVDYAIGQGSQSADKYYMAISKMENKALFIVETKYKNLRDVLGVVDLSTIQNADHIVAKALKDGMNDKLHYKDIFKLAKERVLMFAEIRGKSPLLSLEED